MLLEQARASSVLTLSTLSRHGARKALPTWDFRGSDRPWDVPSSRCEGPTVSKSVRRAGGVGQGVVFQHVLAAASAIPLGIGTQASRPHPFLVLLTLRTLARTKRGGWSRFPSTLLARRKLQSSAPWAAHGKGPDTLCPAPRRVVSTGPPHVLTLRAAALPPHPSSPCEVRPDRYARGVGASRCEGDL